MSTAAYRKLHYQTNKAAYAARNRREYITKRFWINAQKRKPCADCGRRFPSCVMDFDHVRGSKRFSIARALTRSIEVLRDEIAKCDVVCANCHRLRTQKRRQAA